MTDSIKDFTLQRLAELRENDIGIFLEREIATAKHNFPVVLEVRADSLVGRGHHESYHLHVPSGRIMCFLWDEDHDERVFLAASKILQSLPPKDQAQVLMFSERKGSLTIVATNAAAAESLEKTVPKEIEGGCDYWPVAIVSSGTELAKSAIVNDSEAVTRPYLQNLLETRSALERVWKCLELRDMETAARRRALANSREASRG